MVLFAILIGIGWMCFYILGSFFIIGVIIAAVLLGGIMETAGALAGLKSQDTGARWKKNGAATIQWGMMVIPKLQAAKHGMTVTKAISVVCPKCTQTFTLDAPSSMGVTGSHCPHCHEWSYFH